MPGISVSKICVPFGGGGINWSSYWAKRHPEIATYVAGLTTPLSTQEIIRLGESIEVLKDGMGITLLSDAFDCIWLMGGAQREASRRNLVKDAHHLTEKNTLTFTANAGFTNAATGYFDTNYNPAEDADKLSRNSATIGFNSNTAGNQNTLTQMGVMHAGVGILEILATSSQGAIFYLVNDVTDSCKAFDGLNDGLFSAVRLNATQKIIYRNKTANTIASGNSTGLPNGNLYLMAENFVGTGPRRHWIGQMSFAYVGRGMSQTDIDAINDFYATYAFFLT